MRFVRIIKALSSKGILRDLGLIPLLAGAVGEEDYAAQVGNQQGVEWSGGYFQKCFGMEYWEVDGNERCRGTDWIFKDEIKLK